MKDLEAKVRSLSPAKALAILSYGESVASYRYRTLAERTNDASLRHTLQTMADEEQGHNEIIQAQLQKHFPGSDFVLSSEDKELASVGTRLLDLTGPDYFAKAMTLMYESELRTGRVYALLHEQPPVPSLAPLMKEMADECFEHAKQLSELPGATA